MAKFLSKQNLEHIYDYLKCDLKSINIDLNSDKKYMKALVKKMMRSIDNQASESGKQMSMDNMNVFAVSKLNHFLLICLINYLAERKNLLTPLNQKD